MSDNPVFANGEYSSPQGAVMQNREWTKLKETLDQLGPDKSVEQWKICWRDQKRKARAEKGAANYARAQTGNYIPIPPISENASLILGVIGNEMAVGRGPKESSIGIPSTSTSTLQEEPSPSTFRDEPSHTDANVSTEVIEESIPLRLPQRRARRALPPNNFLQAQLDQNAILRELVGEVRNVGAMLNELLNRL